MSPTTENVNVAFEMINEAVEQFSEFILGFSENNIYEKLFSDGSEEDKNQKADREAKRKIRKAFSGLCDRTNGGVTLSNSSTKFNNDLPEGIDTSPIISIIYPSAQLSSNTDLSLAGLEDEATKNGYQNDPFKEILKYIDPDSVSILTITGSNTTGSNTTETKYEIKYDNNLSLSVSPPNSLNAQGQANLIDKFQNPSIGAVIIKDPVFGFNSRNSNHMPVFLSAVSPIEMSRCTPFLNVKTITKKRDGELNKMGIYNFLRYEKNKSTNEDVLFNDEKPVDGEYSELIDGNYNFMDIFTSPQTMINPEINKSLFDVKNIKDRRNAVYSKEQTIKDPFQPFLSLLSFSVSVTGIGYGILSTKKAILKIKLHDKSRIKDISSLLSPNEFGFTKFVIEYGWSHPDGSVTSNNTIGKYLNALRDEGIYQLVNANYSFGNDNSVDITLNLICSGFQKLKTVSCAGGVYTNLNAVIDDLEDDLSEAFKDENNVKEIKDIRANLKISNSDLSSRSTLVLFEKLQEIKKIDFSSGSDRESFIKKILNVIYANGDLDSEGENALYNQLDVTADDVENYYKASPGDIIFSKFKSLNLGVDPFRGEVVKSYYENSDLKTIKTKNDLFSIPLIGDPTANDGSNKYKNNISDNEFVSLGKIISMFIGYPLSTLGLYDEVQMFFYPVNTQSGAARKHTTASLPIELKVLEEQLLLRLRAGEKTFKNLSIHAFFTMLERIVSNRSSKFYGIHNKSLNEDLDRFQKQTFEQKVAEATAANVSVEINENENTEGLSDDEIKNIKNNRLVNKYESVLRKKISDGISEKLEKVYREEDKYFPNYYVDDTKFTPINLSMYFETFSPTTDAVEDDKDLFKKIFGDIGKRREINDNGKISSKTILRIHFYDENSNMNPDNTLYGSNTNASFTAIDKNLLNNFSYIKSLLMKKHPTIIHGASTATVNNISISSNTTGDLSNISLVDSYEQSINGFTGPSESKDLDETILLPTTINLETMGFPMMARGQQLFIDFGTNTSLDNVYTIKDVNHEISPGNFKTSSTLVAANQVVVSSYSKRLKKILEKNNL